MYNYTKLYTVFYWLIAVATINFRYKYVRAMTNLDFYLNCT